MSTYDYTVNALVIRELPEGDHDKRLTLLTADNGRISVLAKGARSLRNPYLAASRAFVWGNFELHRKGDLSWVRDASVTEQFAAIQSDLDKIYLAQYIADVCYELSGEGEPAGDILRLALNSYAALCADRHSQEQIKAVFELRAAALSGYQPDLSGCGRCGARDAEGWYLDVMNGCTVCARCVASAPPQPAGTGEEISADAASADPYGTRSILLHVTDAALAAMKYILSAPPQRILSFELRDPADLSNLSSACEKYLLNHLERGFSSLKLYHSIRNM